MPFVAGGKPKPRPEAPAAPAPAPALAPAPEGEAQRCQIKDSSAHPCKNAGKTLADFVDADGSVTGRAGEPFSLWACWACGKEVLLAKCRDDFCTFAEYVATDDETGEPIEQAPIHRRWAEMCDQYDRLLIWSHINSGKTTQLSILRTIWELGNDPTLRFVILSNTSSIATKIVKSIANYIKNSPEVHEVFPNLAPDPEGSWTNTELTVLRKTRAKDPSVRAVGVHGSLTSGRVDRLVVDDILDPENTDTDANRKKVQAWYKAVAVGRLTKRAKVLVVGTAYHPKDLLHELAKQKGWKWFRFPIFDAQGRVTWPEHWPLEMITQKKEELGPAEFARQLLCLARDDEEARFKQAWIDVAMAKGDGLPLVLDLTEIFPDGLPEGWAVFVGVDIGVRRTKKSDDTVFFTFLEDPFGNRRLLNIVAGKFKGPEIVTKVLEHVRNYTASIAIENVAAQDFLLQFTTEIANIPIYPHTTTKAKKDPVLGVEGLAVELSNGKWILPNVGKVLAPEVDEFVTEMLYYSPKGHTGDRLMACYFARELSRRLRGNRSVPSIGLRILGGDKPNIQATASEGGKNILQRLFEIVKPKDDVGGGGGEASARPAEAARAEAARAALIDITQRTH